MQIDMRPAFALLVAEHRAMIDTPLGPIDRAADDLLARLARLDDEDFPLSSAFPVPEDSAEDHADVLGAGEG